jgi:hypothetical protein
MNIHGPRPAAVEVMTAASTKREQAAATLDNPKQIVSRNVGALSPDGAANLPLVDALHQNIHHVRKAPKRTPLLCYNSGQPPAKRRRKYDTLDERLVQLVSEYDATKVLEFLISVAHNHEIFV